MGQGVASKNLGELRGHVHCYRLRSWADQQPRLGRSGDSAAPERVNRERRDGKQARSDRRNRTGRVVRAPSVPLRAGYGGLRRGRWGYERAPVSVDGLGGVTAGGIPKLTVRVRFPSSAPVKPVVRGTFRNRTGAVRRPCYPKLSPGEVACEVIRVVLAVGLERRKRRLAREDSLGSRPPGPRETSVRELEMTSSGSRY